jgi:hypothetical protein
MGNMNYDGQVIISSVITDDGRIHPMRIDQADPLVRISAEIVIVAQANDSPWVSFDSQSQALTIRDDFGKKVTYRLDRHDPLHEYWEASWPD